MEKKLIMLCSMIILAGCLIFSQNYKKKSFLILNEVSADKAEEIQKTRTQKFGLDFSCLLCNETRVPFDDGENTFYISVNMEEDTWEALSFTSGQSEYEILFQKDLFQYDKKKTIADGTKIPMLVYNEKEYETYYLVFSGLPIIDLTTDVGMWQENICGNIAFYDTDFSRQGIIQSQYQGHLRGNTSRVYPKKGYKINLIKESTGDTVAQNKQSVFGMRTDEDWILYAMYNDPSKIRDRLSIDIWNSFGSGEISKNAVYGTNLTYVEIIADNSYCGLYGLMEPVDAKQLNLNENDYLYKRKDPDGLVYEDFAQAQDPYAQVNGFEIKAGEMNENAWLPIAEFSKQLNSSSQNFAEVAGQIMDVDNAMRMWLFIQVITGHDQRAKNVFYVAKSEAEGYRFYFAPWDMDLTWGNVSVGEINPLYTDFEMDTYDDDIPWETGDRLIFQNVNGAADAMQQLYKELRKGILSDENLESHILELDGFLRNSGAYGRDLERWPEGAHAEDCTVLISYAKVRMEFLDSALFDLENYD